MQFPSNTVSQYLGALSVRKEDWGQLREWASREGRSVDPLAAYTLGNIYSLPREFLHQLSYILMPGAGWIGSLMSHTPWLLAEMLDQHHWSTSFSVPKKKAESSRAVVLVNGDSVFLLCWNCSEELMRSRLEQESPLSHNSFSNLYCVENTMETISGVKSCGLHAGKMPSGNLSE